MSTPPSRMCACRRSAGHALVLFALVATPAFATTARADEPIRTLDPGDVIACGTSIGVGSMKPGSTVEVAIDGIGTLVNRFE